MEIFFTTRVYYSTQISEGLIAEEELSRENIRQYKFVPMKTREESFFLSFVDTKAQLIEERTTDEFDFRR